MTARPAPAAPPTPVLLRSLSSAVLLDGSGDVELMRETRGTTVDWGGVYAQLVRLTGPWRLFVDVGPVPLSLRQTCVAARTDGDLFEGDHRVGPLTIRQHIAPLSTPAGAVRSLKLSTDGPEPLELSVFSSFVPFLFPVLVEGIRPVSFRVETAEDALRVVQRGFGLELRWSVAPSHLFVDRGSWLGGHRAGPVGEIGSEHRIRVLPGVETELRLSITGGLVRDRGRSSGPGDPSLPEPRAVAAVSRSAEEAWLASTPTVAFPAAPELEGGYDFARRTLRRLYTEPGDEMTGLVAGYPWYSSIWCRDLAWMLPALLWLGDVPWVERSISTVFRFQARSSLPILGAEPGELPMQLSPGPVFLYGTSDTSLYYPDLLLRLSRHAGREELARRLRPAVGRIVEWGIARSDPTTGLLRNGGEVEEISSATTGLGHIRYGIDSPDTTIWDSTDRRDHAIDVQVLWWQTLRAAAEISAGTPEQLARARALADRLATTIRERFAWAEEGYLYDSLRGGQGSGRMRPNALRAVSAGLLPLELGRSIVLRAARDDLTTPWGVRTLSSQDPGYRPDAYHDGQVWPIATAWAADAALCAGEVDLGIGYLRQMAAQYADGGVGANECFRGDRPEPFDSCFVLGFSIAPFLTTLFERLWGLRVDGRVPRLEVRPRFPDGWREASIDRLRVGPGLVSVAYRTPRLNVGWSGPGALEVETTGGNATVGPGGRVSVELPTPSGGSALPGEPS
jgi:glycogen debranching enzyme